VQVKQLAMITAGTEFAEDWHGNSKAADFFSLKGDLESLLPKSCVFKPSTRLGFHPGQTADIFVDGKLVGFIGTIHPTTVKTLDLVPGVAFAQVELETVLSVGVPSFKGVSKFPEVRRDLAFIVKRDVTSGELTATIDTLLNDSEIYQGVGVFDVYEGEAIDKQRKSIALGLTFRHNSRTLNDEEVNDCVNIVIDGLGETYEATLRN
jgi:phenylalanyl-tRNA synthetase beta chain